MRGLLTLLLRRVALIRLRVSFGPLAFRFGPRLKTYDLLFSQLLVLLDVFRLLMALVFLGLLATACFLLFGFMCLLVSLT